MIAGTVCVPVSMVTVNLARAKLELVAKIMSFFRQTYDSAYFHLNIKGRYINTRNLNELNILSVKYRVAKHTPSV